MQPLSPRQQSILNRVVDTYIETGQPVGSGAISVLFRGLYGDSYSSATLRHEMGCLEECGYLTHPHTSAGRVPTDLGYRYYVDHGLRRETVSDFPGRDTVEKLSRSASRMDTFSEMASRELSVRSDELSLIVIPAAGAGKELREPDCRVFIDGTSRMLGKPEFREVEKVRDLFKAIEEKTEVIDWLTDVVADKDEVSVTIGEENKPKAFHPCAIVSASYAIDRETVGIVAVIGARRLRYSRMIPLVARMRSLIEEILDERSDES